MPVNKFNIYETLRDVALLHPDQIAIIDEFGPLTYAELFKLTESLREGLESKGVGTGIGVGIIADDNRNFIISLYAIIGSGAVAMPISSKLKPDEITKATLEGHVHFVLGDSKISVALTGNLVESLSSEFDFSISRTSFDVNNHIADFIDNPAFIRFTSGTTGKAKGVIISHESVLQRIEAANEALQITSGDKIMWVLPMAYHFIVSIVLYLKNGATIIAMNDFMAQEMISTINEHKATLIYGSPMHIKLLAAYQGDAQLPSIRKVLSTTIGISANTCIDFHNKFNIHVTQAFGIIEVGLPIVNTMNATDHSEAIGHALPAYNVAILDDNYSPLNCDEPGLLGISGPGMFDGYLSPPTKRNDILKNGWFITGDIAVMSVQGLITIKGRKKNVINVQGNKVFPNEVEEVINRFKNVLESKVYGKAHPLLGEIVAADLVVSQLIDIEELISHCRKHLSSFKLPQSINFVNEIEITGSGKIKRAD